MYRVNLEYNGTQQSLLENIPHAHLVIAMLMAKITLFSTSLWCLLHVHLNRFSVNLSVF